MVETLKLNESELKISEQILSVVKELTLHVKNIKIQKSDHGYTITSDDIENNFFVKVENLENYLNYLKELDEYRVTSNYFHYNKMNAFAYIPFGVYLCDQNQGPSYFVNEKGDEITQDVIDQMTKRKEDYLEQDCVNFLKRRTLSQPVFQSNVFGELVYDMNEIYCKQTDMNQFLKHIESVDSRCNILDKRNFRRFSSYYESEIESDKYSCDQLLSNTDIAKYFESSEEEKKIVSDFVEMGVQSLKTKLSSGLPTIKEDEIRKRATALYHQVILNEKVNRMNEHVKMITSSIVASIKPKLEVLDEISKKFYREEYQLGQILNSYRHLKKGKCVRNGKHHDLDFEVEAILASNAVDQAYLDELLCSIKTYIDTPLDIKKILSNHDILGSYQSIVMKRIPISEYRFNTTYKVPLDLALTATEKEAIASYVGEGHIRMGVHLNGLNEHYSKLACGEETLYQITSRDLKNLEVIQKLYPKCISNDSYCVYRGVSREEGDRFGAKVGLVQSGCLKSATRTKDVALRFAGKTKIEDHWNPNRKDTISCLERIEIDSGAAIVDINEALWGTCSYGKDEDEILILPQNAITCKEPSQQVVTPKGGIYRLSTLGVTLLPSYCNQLQREESIKTK